MKNVSAIDAVDVDAEHLGRLAVDATARIDLPSVVRSTIRISPYIITMLTTKIGSAPVSMFSAVDVDAAGERDEGLGVVAAVKPPNSSSIEFSRMKRHAQRGDERGDARRVA